MWCRACSAGYRFSHVSPSSNRLVSPRPPPRPSEATRRGVQLHPALALRARATAMSVTARHRTRRRIQMNAISIICVKACARLRACNRYLNDLWRRRRRVGGAVAYSAPHRTGATILMVQKIALNTRRCYVAYALISVFICKVNGCAC